MGKSDDKYDTLPDWWLELCPENFTRDFCLEKIRPSRYRMAIDKDGKALWDVRGEPYSLAEKILSTANSLATVWAASEFKTQFTESNRKGYGHHTDQSWYETGEEEGSGILPRKIAQQLSKHLENLKDELQSDAVTTGRRPLPVDFDAWPHLPEAKITQIINYLAVRPVEVVHYLGYADTEILRALVKTGRYKVSALDMHDKFGGRGYSFDKNWNILYQGRPDWLNGIPIYSEGAPLVIDVWIQDYEYGSAIHSLLEGGPRPRPKNFILIGKAIETGLNDYYEWKIVHDVYFGQLKPEHEQQEEFPEEYVNSLRGMGR